MRLVLFGSQISLGDRLLGVQIACLRWTFALLDIMLQSSFLLLGFSYLIRRIQAISTYSGIAF